MLKFTVDGTPVAWSRTRVALDHRAVAPRMRFFNTQRMREWKRQLASAAALAVRKGNWRKLESEPIGLIVVVRIPMPVSWSKAKRIQNDAAPCTSKPDCDNLVKVTDAFSGIVWRDDAQVTTVRVTKRWAKREEAGIDFYIEDLSKETD